MSTPKDKGGRDHREESKHMAMSNKPMLLQVIRQRIRLRHHGHATEKSYAHAA